MRRAFVLLLGVVLLAPQARAHSYPDPALRSVLDAVRPALPVGVQVALVPSVVDQLVLTNTSAAPLELLGADGRPFLRLAAGSVEADLGHADWYRTAVPTGGLRRPSGTGARWSVVSRGSTWSVFDPRVRPHVTVTPELRRAGLGHTLATWEIPLRYGGAPVLASGYVRFEPVLGGLTVAVDSSPDGLEATALQGRLPGLLLRVPDRQEVVVMGRDGLPFLRFRDDAVEARVDSPSWRDDRAAGGVAVVGTGWVRVGSGPTYSWLDPRLRYPRDVPPEELVGLRSVVQRWEVPLLVDGRTARIAGTVTWVPRAEGVAQVRAEREAVGSRSWVWPAAVGLAVAAACGAAVMIRRRSSRER